MELLASVEQAAQQQSSLVKQELEQLQTLSARVNSAFATVSSAAAAAASPSSPSTTSPMISGIGSSATPAAPQQTGDDLLRFVTTSVPECSQLLEDVKSQIAALSAMSPQLFSDLSDVKSAGSLQTNVQQWA